MSDKSSYDFVKRDHLSSKFSAFSNSDGTWFHDDEFIELYSKQGHNYAIISTTIM